ncbi:hypothetical protein BH10ACI1_BH10ACI1_19660 [soil metagenome]
MANPPFNISDWWNKSLEKDARWQFGTPPQGNANYAWLQHGVICPTPRKGLIRTSILTFR